MFRVFQPQVFPAFAAIRTEVNPISITNMSSSDILTGSNPDNQRVLRINSYTAYRVRALIIKYWFPCCTCICRFPYTTRTNRNVPLIRIIWINSYVCNTARAECWSDVPEFYGLYNYKESLNLYYFSEQLRFERRLTIKCNKKHI